MVDASARVHGFTIVSEEKLNLDMKKRVANPNVCHQFGMPSCNVFEMLRRTKVKFGLRMLLGTTSNQVSCPPTNDEPLLLA